jgi:dipeptidyl aminopeptidase/acylaminoacyl peptidase
MRRGHSTCASSPWAAVLFVNLAVMMSLSLSAGEQDFAKLKAAQAETLKAELKLSEVPFKIVYETYRETNWELFMISADGSNPVNLTRTSNVDEMYPHVSPDATRISFVADEETGKGKIRNVYYMNVDGTGRTRVAENARQPCWSPDGKSIAYHKAEFERYTTRDYATRELFIYDLRTRKHRQHPNKNLHHLYNICWSPDRDWFFATVHGGMGFRHAQLAFEANGTRVFDLTPWRVTGCRLDVSPDGKKLVWGRSDEALTAGNWAVTSVAPRVTDVRDVAICPKGFEVYHADWSPDGKYIAFSFGPAAEEIVGGRAKGWNICVGDLTGKWVPITTDGKDNKEPDWVPLRRAGQ